MTVSEEAAEGEGDGEFEPVRPDEQDARDNIRRPAPRRTESFFFIENPFQ